MKCLGRSGAMNRCIVPRVFAVVTMLIVLTGLVPSVTPQEANECSLETWVETELPSLSTVTGALKSLTQLLADCASPSVESTDAVEIVQVRFHLDEDAHLSVQSTTSLDEIEFVAYFPSDSARFDASDLIGGFPPKRFSISKFRPFYGKLRDSDISHLTIEIPTSNDNVCHRSEGDQRVWTCPVPEIIRDWIYTEYSSSEHNFLTSPVAVQFGRYDSGERLTYAMVQSTGSIEEIELEAYFSGESKTCSGGDIVGNFPPQFLFCGEIPVEDVTHLAMKFELLLPDGNMFGSDFIACIQDRINHNSWICPVTQ